MRIAKKVYETIKKEPAPYYYEYSLITLFVKPVRKFFVNVVAPNCVSNIVRIAIYKACGFDIGKNVFIGMHCYLDDMCYDLISIGNNVTISYGVYFACHGKNQGHYPIRIEDGAYIGMRASLISKNANGSDSGIIIGKEAVIGSNCLVNMDIPDGKTAVGIPCRIVGENDE